MSRDWQDLRYRGDRLDVEEMLTTYRVGDYLDAFEQNRRQRESGVREELLHKGIRLTERLSPRIFRIHRGVSEALGVPASAEVFCLPDARVNAFAILDAQARGDAALVGVTSAALERLDDRELASVLGHELGHIVLGNNRLNALLVADPQNPAATVLPPFGEALFLRWRKKAELSADRVGLVASGDFRSSARALIKCTFGLGEENLNLDVDALVAQIDELRGQPQLITEAFASHPLLPIRLKSLDLFARSAKASRHGVAVTGDTVSDDALEDGVDELMRLTRRHPVEPLPDALMQAVALGGALVLASDGDVEDGEVRALIGLVHRWFTDEPERVIATRRDEIDARLPAVLATVIEKGDDTSKTFVLSRLAEIALADGALVDAEADAILAIGAQLGVPAKVTWSVIVGAAQSVGFRTDAKLNRLSRELREAMSAGLRATS